MGEYIEGFLKNVSTQTHKNLEIVLDHNDPTEAEIKLVEEHNVCLIHFMMKQLLVKLRQLMKLFPYRSRIRLLAKLLVSRLTCDQLSYLLRDEQNGR